MEKKNKAKILIAVLAVVLVALIAVFALLGNKNKTGTGVAESTASSGVTTEAADKNEGTDSSGVTTAANKSDGTDSSGGTAAADKAIKVEVIMSDGSRKTLNLNTKAQTLREALEEHELISGDESSYGLFVKTVDGVTADDSKQEWWCFTKGGEMLTVGVDAIQIADGDTYEITLKTGYDY